MPLNGKTTLQTLRLSRYNRWLKMLLIALGFLAGTNPGITANVLQDGAHGEVRYRADHSLNGIPTTLRIPTFNFILHGYLEETEITEEDDRPDDAYAHCHVRRSSLSIADDMAVSEGSATSPDRRKRIKLFTLFHSWKSYLP